jgi:hypothetical protein
MDGGFTFLARQAHGEMPRSGCASAAPCEADRSRGLDMFDLTARHRQKTSALWEELEDPPGGVLSGAPRQGTKGMREVDVDARLRRSRRRNREKARSSIYPIQHGMSCAIHVHGCVPTMRAGFSDMIFKRAWPSWRSF